MTEPVVYKGPDHFSVSQVHAIRDNSWHWFLERVARVPRRPAWALVGGKAVHSATEQIDMEEQFALNLGEAGDLFEHHLKLTMDEEAEHTGVDPAEWRASGRASKQYPNKENQQWWVDNGPSMLMSWVNWRNDNPSWTIPLLGGKPAIEAKITGSVGGSMPMLGYIDRVMLNEATNEWIVVDLKSGARAPGDVMQLGTYSIFLEMLFGIRPRWGTYWMARNGTATPPVDLTQVWPLERLVHDLKAAEAVVRSNALSCSQNQFAASSSAAPYCYACTGIKDDTILPWEVRVELPGVSS